MPLRIFILAFVIIAHVPAYALDFYDRYFALNTIVNPDKPLQIDSIDNASSLWIQVRGQVKGNRNSHKPSRQRWGLEWTDSVSHAHYRTVISWGNTDFTDFTDERYLQVDLLRNDSIIVSHRFTTEVALHDNANTLGIFFYDSRLQIRLGRQSLKHQFDVPGSYSTPKDLAVWSSTALRLTDIYTRLWPDYAAIAPPVWTLNELKEYFAKSIDPLEGFWTYLDRTNNPDEAYPGGRYTLATVANGHQGYDIIMVGGATHYPRIWQCGTIKGELLPTIFVDTYRLRWRTAKGEWMDINHDLSATIDNNALLTLRFPIVDTTIRLSKVPLSSLR